MERRILNLTSLAAACSVAFGAERTLRVTGQIALPPLMIDGQPARAHTQGLWVHDGVFFVTARRDDVDPRRALLLRTEPSARQWSIWDLTPDADSTADGHPPSLDHPGGFDSDGGALWIPVSTSTPQGPTSIRVYDLKDLTPNRPVTPARAYQVEDHIGALAVSAERDEVYGASWDTRRVYVWNRDGELLKKLQVDGLSLPRHGSEGAPTPRSGLAVQDWKMHGGNILAGGLLKGGGSARLSPRSRLFVIDAGLKRTPLSYRLQWEEEPALELAREGMAVDGGSVYVLPEDLGAKNRLFRLELPSLVLR